MKYSSWGKYPSLSPHTVWSIDRRGQDISFSDTDKYFLCYGQGKSYGDSCLIDDDGILLHTAALNRILSFDKNKGILRCEAGVTFTDILRVITGQGWFLPVLPGTQYISIGGALANDVHGKNHNRAGTFGCYVLCFELLRSNGQRYICSLQQNVDLYKATIGGLGLTGIITWVEIQLKPIQTTFLETEKIKFYNLNQFLDLQNASENDFEYIVSWLDCLSGSSGFGRGIFMRGNHSQQVSNIPLQRIKSIPCHFPNIALNHCTMRLFNAFYFNKQFKNKHYALQHYQTFFFPLDSVLQWNKIYGRRGFLQYQCVVPDISIIDELLNKIVHSKQGSFLSVLKKFSNIESPGLLSFPQAGISLALDFPFRGQKTLTLLNELDQIVMNNKGRVYPAKDARMSSEAFKHYFPNWKKLLILKDPRFTSHFWQRVVGE